MAVIKLDNITVAQTSWKQTSQQAWDQRFSIDLDKSRELEIGIYWRDWRSLCAVKFLRLEEFIDDIRHGMALQLEPTGLLFAEIKFLNPMISRKPKLQRQRMIFNKQAKNIPRAKQMNINIVTWGRLLKRSTPSNQQQSAVSTPTSTHPPYGNGGGPQPVQLVFEGEPSRLEPAETPGENPDNNVVGLSGARPLGMMQGISALPESPAPPQAQPRPSVPAKQKKPPALPPKMDQEVSRSSFVVVKGQKHTLARDKFQVSTVQFQIFRGFGEISRSNRRNFRVLSRQTDRQISSPTPLTPYITHLAPNRTSRIRFSAKSSR
jgi:protein kinase N